MKEKDPFRWRGALKKDLVEMMYGFGDVKHPAGDTLDLVEELVVDYIQNLCLEASKVAERRKNVTVNANDFRHVLRRDPKKLGRAEYLLQMQARLDHLKDGSSAALENIGEARSKGRLGH